METITSPALLSEHHAARRGGAVALTFADRAWTWAQVHDAVLRTVAALRARGLHPGDRIAFVGYNSDHYVILLQACYRAGIVLAPLNWRLTASEIDDLLARSAARLVVADAIFAPLLDALAPQVRARIETLVSDPQADDPAFRRWIDGHTPDPSDPVTDPAADALLLFTSGTTGAPKGALLTHANLVAPFRNMRATGERWGVIDERTVTMVVTPIFHVGGTGSANQGLIGGAKICVLPRPDVAMMVAAILRHRITRVFAVPAMLSMILHDPAARDADFSSVTVLCYGASPIPLDLLRASMAKFPNADFVQLYGMTETSGNATYLPAEDHDPQGNARMASCGKAYAGTEVRILDPEGRTVPPRTTGEIAVKSGCVMKGYLDDSGATARAIVDGFYRSGDAGYMDEDGYVFIQDRLKDMIISGGENIYPAEVERVLGDHPAVRECAVVGIPDDRWGEVALAFVVPADGGLDEADVRAFLRARLAGYKLPKSYRIIDALPRNPSGKVLKRELRAPFWEGRSRQVG